MALRRQGEDVLAAVRPASRALWDDDPGVDVRRLDLRVQRGLEEAVAGVDTVVHLAAAMGGGCRSKVSVVGVSDGWWVWRC